MTVAFLLLAGVGFWYLQFLPSNAPMVVAPTPLAAVANPIATAIPSTTDLQQDGAIGTAQPETNQLTYTYQGSLKDVTRGVVRGITTNGTAQGSAMADFREGTYQLLATVENLPEPLNGDFYEGWVVQKRPFKFISTGKLERVNGVYTNRYTAAQDFTSYTQYVLTIEPDDGDPAPAAHIVEGEMAKK